MNFQSSDDAYRAPSPIHEYIVIVVEDHPSYAAEVDTSIRDAFENTSESVRKAVVTKHIATELEFLKYFSQITPSNLPALFVIDSMLRWTDPGPNLLPPPDEVRRGGYVEAGLRCIKRIVDNPLTETLPIILNTILDEEDINGLLREQGSALKQLPDSVIYVHKGDSEKHLTNVIRRIISSYKRG